MSNVRIFFVTWNLEPGDSAMPVMIQVPSHVQDVKDYLSTEYDCEVLMLMETKLQRENGSDFEFNPDRSN